MTSYSLAAIISKTKRKAFKGIAPVIDPCAVKAAFSRANSRERIYHAWPLFQTWLNQRVRGISCREAVSWSRSSDLIPRHVSPKTAAYCNARSRLPEGPMKTILTSIGLAAEESSDKRRRKFRRRMVVVDGTSVQLQDTPANQSEYPQPSGQAPGCGQPAMCVVALMGLGSGAILDLAVGRPGHDRELFRGMWPSLRRSDILVADNGFCSFAEFACLMQRGVDLIMSQRADCLDTKQIRQIEKNDYLVTWPRGPQKLKWIEREDLPEQLTVRAVSFSHGGRDGVEIRKVLFTTLLDPIIYPRIKILELFRRRWEVEVSFDDIKTEMGMDLLGCKSPRMCRCELFIGLIAYNIIRAVMLDAARSARLDPRRISFAGAKARIVTCLGGSVFSTDPSYAYAMLVRDLAKDSIPSRPGRNEPRKVKRRPKNYRLLMSHRNLTVLAPSNP